MNKRIPISTIEFLQNFLLPTKESDPKIMTTFKLEYLVEFPIKSWIPIFYKENTVSGINLYIKWSVDTTGSATLSGR